MARDPLRILLAVRRRAVEQARYALEACLGVEAEIVEGIRSLDDTARRDREAGGAWQDAHQFVEMTAVRLEARQTDRRALEADLVAAEGRTADARTVLTAARTAAEAVAHLADSRAAAAQAELDRREQHVLDDIARARHGMRQRNESG